MLSAIIQSQTGKKSKEIAKTKGIISPEFSEAFIWVWFPNF